jgi:hypothetical protein
MPQRSRRRTALICLAALSLALAAALAAGCAALSPRVEDFRRVQPGWTLEEVERYLGPPDRSYGAGGLASAWEYRAYDSAGAPTAVLRVVSVGGQVVHTQVQEL